MKLIPRNGTGLPGLVALERGPGGVLVRVAEVESRDLIFVILKEFVLHRSLVSRLVLGLSS